MFVYALGLTVGCCFFFVCELPLLCVCLHTTETRRGGKEEERDTGVWASTEGLDM